VNIKEDAMEFGQARVAESFNAANEAFIKAMTSLKTTPDARSDEENHILMTAFHIGWTEGIKFWARILEREHQRQEGGAE